MAVTAMHACRSLSTLCWLGERLPADAAAGPPPPPSGMARPPRLPGAPKGWPSWAESEAIYFGDWVDARDSKSLQPLITARASTQPAFSLDYCPDDVLINVVAVSVG